MQGKSGQASHVAPAVARASDAFALEALDAPGASPAGAGEPAAQAEVVRLVNEVLATAIRERASDIHFEPFEHEFRVRCRVDGALRETMAPPPALARPVISRLKVLANVNLAERRVPQDGRIRMTLGGQAADFRLSTLPTQFGESVVLRVLDQAAGRLELAEIGLPEPVLAGVSAVLERPHGMFIVTGPTGSGKTTTLYSCLKRLNTTAAKLLTIEDPVEYEIEGIMQVAVNPVANLTFARALRTFLRQDPDVVMVGEIRDTETAQIGIQAALTGHLVLATLHTNDAPSAMTRLADLGVEPFLLASTVEAVLAQRLLRRVCPDCREAYEPTAALRAQVGLIPEQGSGEMFYRATGCLACRQTGYRGRLGLFEFLPLTDRLRELVAEGAPLMELRRQATEEGMVALREAGLRAARGGETTLEEILKYT